MSGSPKWSSFEVDESVRVAVSQQVAMDMAEARRVTLAVRERMLQELRDRRAAAPQRKRTAVREQQLAQPSPLAPPTTIGSVSTADPGQWRLSTLASAETVVTSCLSVSSIGTRQSIEALPGTPAQEDVLADVRVLSQMSAASVESIANSATAGSNTVTDVWQSTIDSLHATVLSRASDQFVSAHCSDELAGLEAAIDRVQDAVPTPEAIAEAISIGSRLIDIDAEARRREESRRIRDYVVNGILTVLGSMGFSVTQPPSGEDPSDPSASINFSAVRPGRGAIAVSVPLTGEVWYTVGGGYVSRAGRTADGSMARSCDEAEETIREMQDAVGKHFHVHLDDPMWEGKQTRPNERSAVDTPTDAQGQHEGGEGR